MAKQNSNQISEGEMIASSHRRSSFMKPVFLNVLDGSKSPPKSPNPLLASIFGGGGSNAGGSSSPPKKGQGTAQGIGILGAFFNKELEAKAQAQNVWNFKYINYTYKYYIFKAVTSYSENLSKNSFISDLDFISLWPKTSKTKPLHKKMKISIIDIKGEIYMEFNIPKSSSHEFYLETEDSKAITDFLIHQVELNTIVLILITLEDTNTHQTSFYHRFYSPEYNDLDWVQDIMYTHWNSLVVSLADQFNLAERSISQKIIKIKSKKKPKFKIPDTLVQSMKGAFFYLEWSGKRYEKIKYESLYWANGNP